MTNQSQQPKRFAITEYKGVILDRVTDVLYRCDTETGDYLKVSDGFGPDRIKIAEDQIGPEWKRYTFMIKDDGTRRVFDCKTGALYDELGKRTERYKKISKDPGPEQLTLTEEDMEPMRIPGDNEVVFENKEFKLYTVNGVEYQDRKEVRCNLESNTEGW